MNDRSVPFALSLASAAMLSLAVCSPDFAHAQMRSAAKPSAEQNGQSASKQKAKNANAKKQQGFTLERIFPKEGLFGTRARSAAFSHDGRYAVWMWQPLVERRHGADLWLLDTKSGKVKRITSAELMAPFRARARRVVEDRKKKLAKAKSDEARKKGFVDGVARDDSEAKTAPRYDGVSSFTWSPTSHELLFGSGRDVYRYKIGGEIVRVTYTRRRESGVAYLPDGSGFTYMADAALYRLRFASHLTMQIDPELPAGESMAGYKLSPDGKKILCIAYKGSSRRSSSSRRVKIATYRSRFAGVREVPRQVSDDPIPNRESVVYWSHIDEGMTESTKAVEVFRRKMSGPRDVLRMPDWSPDSKRIVFAHFDQVTSQQQIFIAEAPDAAPADKPAGKSAKKGEKPSGGTKTAKASGKNAATSAATSASKTGTTTKAPAKLVFRWLHDGGPTTPRMVEPMFLADNRHVLVLSEANGFRHVHRIDPVYQTQVALTRGSFEVYPLRLDKKRESLLVLATREGATRQDIYRLDVRTSGVKDAQLARVSPKRGYYSDAVISPDGRTALATFTEFGTPRELTWIDLRARKQRAMTKSHPADTLELCKRRPDFFRYENRHGQRIHGYLFKPSGWAKPRKGAERWPLLIYVYGGPLGTRRNVIEGSYQGDGYFFNRYMTQQHGYITCVIDPRGMSGYGALFEKANFENVGKAQAEDLVDGVRHLVKEYGADAKRVGIHGWSFGGFQTQMCLYTAPETFQVGIAGAGPTEWENYNSWYSTGTIGKSRRGTSVPDLQKYPLLPLAKKLKGQLLLVHGMEDANVLYQDSVRIYRKLLEAGKETNVELFVDPTGGHGLGGDVKRLGKARKYESFLLRTLGRGPQKSLPKNKKTA